MKTQEQATSAGLQDRNRGSGVLTLHLLQMILLVSLLGFVGFVYVRLKEAVQAKTPPESVARPLPVTAGELKLALDSHFTSNETHAEELVGGVKRALETDLDKAFSLNEEAARVHRDKLNGSIAKIQKRLEQFNHEGGAQELSRVDVALVEIKRDLKLVNAELRAKGVAATESTEQFEKKVEAALARFGKSITDLDKRFLDYEGKIESYREQIRRYGATSLRPQYTQLVFCHTETARMTSESKYKTLGSIFNNYESQHLLQHSNYVLETKIASGRFLQDWGTGLPEGKPIDLGRLSEDLLSADPRYAKYKKRVVFVAERDSSFMLSSTFRDWCDLNDVEVSIIVVVLPEMKETADSVRMARTWSEFCQGTGGQLVSVFVSQTGTLPPTDVDALSLSIQRALYPVVGSGK